MGKSRNISLVKTSTVSSTNYFKSYNKSTSSHQIYQGIHFLRFYFFNFLIFTFQSLLLPFNNRLGDSNLYQNHVTNTSLIHNIVERRNEILIDLSRNLFDY